MRTRLFDHIDLRVKDLDAGAKFYGQFLPQLGFAHEKYEPAPAGSGLPDNYTFYSAGGGKPAEFFGLTGNKDHRPNDSRIAFWAETRATVDEIAKLVRAAGGKNLEGPSVVPEYSAGYYALFFEDPDGNKLEICCRESPIVAE